MSQRFRLTKPALQDIEEIADYLARNINLTQAENFLDKLNRKLNNIAKFPHLGRQRDEILPNIRSLPLSNYLILYLPTSEGIDVLRVVSGYQNLTNLFEDSSDG
ncbi:type II toxin-antitoxin system RelE/ParE family toxin [[Limnothrix rosea] IAM M-220]|uniref:type II toxin-antitoxin system RelE/ParE family toxin n=1 Tax=[Limnothrix rosea] IAM M-220 TaxID=454133 RepID=UPI00095C13CC|nr:type II toxin-antitoxin system RelE/ParE family toxin [[Limnothrix rosea] IAM M-220]OKH16074.1 plasmid stabilization protein [[Limnothrix rosea] IAM M-220]